MNKLNVNRIFLIVLFFGFVSCGNEINHLENNINLINKENIDLNDYTVIIKKGSEINDESGEKIKIKKDTPAKIIKYEINNNLVDVEINKGKNIKLIGKCDFSIIDLNYDILYFCGKNFSKNSDLLNAIKNYKAENWKLSDVINCLSSPGFSKYFNNYSKEKKREIFQLINYPKNRDYENIDYINCKFPEWIVKDYLIGMNSVEIIDNKLMTELINKNYGEDQDSVLIYALKYGDEYIVNNYAYYLVKQFNADVKINDIFNKTAADYAITNDIFFLDEKETPQIDFNDYDSYVKNWEQFFSDDWDDYKTDVFFFEGNDQKEWDIYNRNKKERIEKQAVYNPSVIDEMENNIKSRGYCHPYFVYPFEDNSFAYVTDKTYILLKNEEKFYLKPGTIVKVLHTFPVRGEDYALYSPFSKYLEAPFVLVQEQRFGNVGLICSFNLAHQKSNVIRDDDTRKYLLMTKFQAQPNHDTDGNVIAGSIYLVEEDETTKSNIIHNPTSFECWDDHKPLEIFQFENEIVMAFTRSFMTKEKGRLDQCLTYFIRDNVLIDFGEFTAYTNDNKNVQGLIDKEVRNGKFIVTVGEEYDNLPAMEKLEIDKNFKLVEDRISEKEGR